jgi:hypothetical protein
MKVSEREVRSGASNLHSMSTLMADLGRDFLHVV